MTGAVRQRAGLGLVERMARTWTAPRAATRLEIDTAGEPRLLFYAFAASVFGILGAVGAQTLNISPEVARDFDLWASTQVAVGLFARPLGLYAAAAAIGLAARSLGGSGGWRDTRAACFWTALTVAPVAVALDVIGAAAVSLGGAPPATGPVAHAAGSVLWAALLAPALAEAHGFRSAWRVLGCLFAVGAGLSLASAALQAAG